MAAGATVLRQARQVRPEATQSVAVGIRGVSHAFDLAGTQLQVLDSIDLSVAAGEFIALLGPSGCGKSTLLRLISGLEQPTAGSITADGSLVDRPDPSRILVFQDPTLFLGRRSGTMLRPGSTRAAFSSRSSSASTPRSILSDCMALQTPIRTSFRAAWPSAPRSRVRW